MEMVGRRLGGYNRLSGSSYEESSTLSGDCYPPATVSTVALDPLTDVKPNEGDGRCAASISGSGSASRSWAQQAEEAYQLQLAFALRLCSQAACITESNFLDTSDQLLHLQPLTSAESVSHQFWVYI